MSLIKSYLKHSLRSGLEFQKCLKLLKASEVYSASELRAYQEENLRRIIKIAYENVPFYNKSFRNLKLTFSDIKTTEDLYKLPLIDKNAVRNNFESFRNRKFWRRIIKSQTSGTSGTPGVFLRDMHSINFENAAVWRSCQWGGKGIGSRRVTLRGEVICSANQKAPPFWKENSFSKELLLSGYHLCEDNFSHYIKAIKDYEPFDLYAYPSTAFLLAEYNLRTTAGLQFSAVFTSSEMVLDYQRDMIERSFQCKLYDWYGQVERVSAISTCEHQSYHVLEDYSITELVPSGEHLFEVVGTTLFNDVMPLIRYRTGDYVTLGDKKCCCNRTFRCINGIEGRDSVKLMTPEGRSINIVNHIPRGVPNLIETQIVQKSLDEIVFRVVCTNTFSNKDEMILLKNARERISSDVKLRIEKVPFIERGKNGKFIPVVSHLN